ncbi:MAG: tRNA lysidine(34) synthetase TilS [Candidatus Saccharimonadales bacterium]
MQIEVAAGRYVVAVSGGVDSVVLLHALVQKYFKSQTNPKSKIQNANVQHAPSNVQLTVAHFDHGIRPDSKADALFVEQLAKKHDLPFESERVELGEGASEAAARTARYEFLKRVQKQYKAQAIITAHHQDDVLETIIINWLRGTKSRGLSSLKDTAEIKRPLLGWSKQQIRKYARLHNVEWREDSTNQDETYLRNYVRHRIMPKLGDVQRTKLLAHSQQALLLNHAIQGGVSECIVRYSTADSISRPQYQALPVEVSREFLAEWLRLYTSATITTKTLYRLDGAIRNGRNNSLVDIARGQSFKLEKECVRLIANQA